MHVLLHNYIFLLYSINGVHCILASWALIWTLSLQFVDNKWSIKDIILIDFLLCLTYPMFAIIYSGVFRILLCLTYHLSFGSIIRLHLNIQEKNDQIYRSYLLLLVVLSSLGFILFSLLDLLLASLWPSVFTVFTGNFLQAYVMLYNFIFSLHYLQNSNMIKLK